ncbi:hypothetical protein LTR97_007871 [Elasticomyces elasticus]|uniref:Uncharacterized protein n=1 Tax=Elasticomyces elasticus TaxID=574655 RepID=A0AAN7VZL0_9PEZI|nr:hypothetical protein LTR97_007871 [Elasticomyces elasticus]
MPVKSPAVAAGMVSLIFIRESEEIDGIVLAEEWGAFATASEALEGTVLVRASILLASQKVLKEQLLLEQIGRLNRGREKLIDALAEQQGLHIKPQRDVFQQCVSAADQRDQVLGARQVWQWRYWVSLLML